MTGTIVFIYALLRYIDAPGKKCDSGLMSLARYGD
jgi:hypothetical protein